MNIAGLLIHAHPSKLAAVEQTLRALPGVELHRTADDGRLVITVEDTAEDSAGDTVLAIHRTNGVLSACLVYHHFEPEMGPSNPGEKIHDSVTA